MKNLDGKVAFVTGGASGIGFGMAKAFLAHGMNVAIADVKQNRLTRAQAELEGEGRVTTIELDVSDLSAVERAADQTEAAFGHVHVVCNNAGIGSTSPLGYAMTEVDWSKVFDVNVHGVFNGVHVFVPRLLGHGEGGHIVNTASTAGLQPNKGQLAYCASKYAVVGMSEVLRKDLADENVSVSVLCPWVVDTAMFHRDIDDADVQAIRKRRESLTWLKDYAVSPDLVGNQVVNAILEDEPFIFCDGKGTRELIEKRTEDLMGALDRQFPE